MLNFTWWVNRKDAEGRNIFQGGFLGLDNIGVFDRSQPLPTGGFINQSDGTAWMAMYTLNLLRIALELAMDDHVYEDIATKFFEHFLYIAEAMEQRQRRRQRPVGRGRRILLRRAEPARRRAACPCRCARWSGLIPLFAVEVLEPSIADAVARVRASRAAGSSSTARTWRAGLALGRAGPGRAHTCCRCCAATGMKALLRRVLDEAEFLSEPTACARCRNAMPSTRSCSRTDGMQYRVDYEPGESTTGLFGGNSNWRGPIWMPVNYLLIESLHEFHRYYGDDFKVEFPVGSG